MFPEKPELSITIPSRTDLLKMLTELTRHIAIRNLFTESESQKVSLAVDEAITNVIKHSYKNEEKGKITLDFFSGDHGIKICVSFAGIPPDLQKNPADVEKLIRDKKKGGLGVTLIKKIMDSVKYNTVEGTNYLEMIKWKKKN